MKFHATHRRISKSYVLLNDKQVKPYKGLKAHFHSRKVSAEQKIFQKD